MYNKVFLIGRLGRDPETFYTQQGSKVVKFNLATTYHLPGRIERYNVIVFGKKADKCAKHLKKTH